MMLDVGLAGDAEGQKPTRRITQLKTEFQRLRALWAGKCSCTPSNAVPVFGGSARL